MTNILYKSSSAEIALISKFPTKIQGLAFHLLISGTPLENLKEEAFKKSNEEEKACGSISFDSESADDFSLYEKLPAPLATVEVDDWRCENFDKQFESIFSILAGTNKEIGVEFDICDRRIQQIIKAAVSKIKKLKETEGFGFSEGVKTILRNEFLKRIDLVFKRQDDFFKGEEA
jgi:hypothetical protein